jgi:hypothetical protein
LLPQGLAPVPSVRAFSNPLRLCWKSSAMDSTSRGKSILGKALGEALAGEAARRASTPLGPPNPKDELVAAPLPPAHSLPLPRPDISSTQPPGTIDLSLLLAPPLSNAVHIDQTRDLPVLPLTPSGSPVLLLISLMAPYVPRCPGMKLPQLQEEGGGAGPSTSHAARPASNAPPARSDVLFAAKQGDYRLLTRVLTRYPDAALTERGGYGYGETALHFAALLPNGAACVSLLLASGSPERQVSVITAGGWTPLMYAAYSQNTDSVRLLLTHVPEAQVVVRDMGGGTALTLAGRHPSLPIMRMLLEHGHHEEQNLDEAFRRVVLIYNLIPSEELKAFIMWLISLGARPPVGGF